ncbi:MAG: zinc ribbon domain-containing protein [Candidatus Latescibacteria bacterium]|nr:zinc ribbon domain-containing protein [Candidatus Latescibacterota bacterium]
MALYEYKCRDCNKISEILVFSSDDIPECKHCGSKNLDKMLSTFAVSMAGGSSSQPMPSCPSGGCCGGNCGI